MPIHLADWPPKDKEKKHCACICRFCTFVICTRETDRSQPHHHQVGEKVLRSEALSTGNLKREREIQVTKLCTSDNILWGKCTVLATTTKESFDVCLAWCSGVCRSFGVFTCTLCGMIGRWENLLRTIVTKVRMAAFVLFFFLSADRT